MKKSLIQNNRTIKEALSMLSISGQKCLIVITKNLTLLGTLSDGDIRKSILRGIDINESINDIYNRKPSFFYENKFTNSDVKLLLIEQRIEIIPIIDKKRKVRKIIFFSDIFDKKNKIISKYKNLNAVIMAGGEGKRLEPFTAILPKPLIPINDKPIIEHIIEKFQIHNIINFHITVNYKSRILKAFFDEFNPNVKVKFVDEVKPLGTASSLKQLINKLRKPFFVTNCDTIIDINYEDLYENHIINNNDITLVASQKEYTFPYGACKLTKKGFLSKILEKPKFDFLINAGLYIINPEILKLIPKNKKFNMTDLIALSKKNKKQIGVYPIDNSQWTDVGEWSEYHKAIDRFI